MTDEVAVMTSEPVLAPETQRAVHDERVAIMAAQVGTFRLTSEQQAALLVHATPAIVEVRPTGELYVPGKLYRDVLNRVFGPGAWAIRHGAPIMDVKEKDWQSTLYLNVFLMAGRCARCARSINACVCFGPVEQACVAMAIGAQAYHPSNARLSYDDALEAAITNGLMRCVAKQLGSYSECWDPRWAEATRAQVAVRVPVQERNGINYRWRRNDRQALDGEQRVVKKSPAGPEPAQSAASPPPTPSSGGEAIGQIRRTEAQGKVYWTVVTDKGEHLTDDEHFVRTLETYKAQGKKVIFEDEVVPTRGGGTKNKIVEFRIV